MPAILANTNEQVRRMVSVYRQAGVEVSFDIETTGLSPHDSKLVMLIFKATGKKATIIDARLWEDADELATLGTLLEPLFDGTVLLVGHNLKFDLGFMMFRCRIEMRKVRVYDTLITEHVILGMGTSEVSKKKLSMKLDAVASRYGIEGVSKVARSWFYQDANGCPSPLDARPEWHEAFPEEQIEYAVQDVRVPLQIRELQIPRLTKAKLIPTAALENRVVPSVAVLTMNGQYIDVDGWMRVVAEAEVESGRLERYLHIGDLTEDATIDSIMACVADPTCFEGFDLYILKDREEKQRPYAQWKANKEADIARSHEDWDAGKYDSGAGEGFKTWGELKRSIQAEWNAKAPRNYAGTDAFKKPPNISSTDQLLAALRGMGIMVPNTKSETLERLEETYPVLGMILDYRQAEKIPTTYGTAMIATQDPVLKRFFPDWKQYGASTGRFSSGRGKRGGYNAQNFPSRGKFKKIKRNVKAPAGWRLVTADFSNIELRILAAMTYKAMGRSNLAKAFASGMDVHEATARMMFDLAKEISVKSRAVIGGKTLEFSWRDIAKTINYGLTYGMGAARLALKLKTTLEIAKELLLRYRTLYDAETIFLKRLKSLVDSAVDEKRSRLKSRTMLGRIRWFDMPVPPTLTGKDKESVHRYEDELKQYHSDVWSVKLASANAPIQGTSADITKLAAALIFEELGNHPYIKLIGIVHDEFMLECYLHGCAPADEKRGWPEENWVRRGEHVLEYCMDTAAKHFIGEWVETGRVEPVHSHYWTHEEPPYMKHGGWQAWWRDQTTTCL